MELFYNLEARPGRNFIQLVGLLSTSEAEGKQRLE